jgi:hypothetical protein
MYGDDNYRIYVDRIIDYIDFDMRAFALLLFSRAYYYMDRDTGKISVDVSVLSYESYMSTAMVDIILKKLIRIGLLRKLDSDSGAVVYYIITDVSKIARYEPLLSSK